MTRSIFKHVRITGIGTVVPEKEICLTDEMEFYNNDIKKIERTRDIVGFFKRRVVEGNTTASDLSIQAAEILMKEMQLSSNEIDALIFVVQNPDYSSPATACIIHQRLGLGKHCPAFDINQGCSGYVHGLWLASSLIEAGNCKKILLCAGDTSSVHADQRNRVTAPIFGDAGTATVLEFSDEETVSCFELGADGNGCESLIVPAGCRKIPFAKNAEENTALESELVHGGNTMYLTDIYMDPMAIFNFTMTSVPPHIKSLMDFASVTPETTDYLVLHQANRQIIQMIAAKLKFPPEKAPCETVTKYGNQTIASIPSVICDVLKEKVSASKQRLIMSGFGVGLSWGSCAVTLDNICCPGISIYRKTEHDKSREELITYWTQKLGGLK